MTRGTRILLGDILEAASLLARYTDALTLDDFADDIEKQDAVARWLEVIGEAVKGFRWNYVKRTPTFRGGISLASLPQESRCG